ncbi:MAG: hypothetical protein ACLFTP_02930 [Rhodosalinus sp.]|uniref:hypothetical protein n=1 Tax=Rhodosalinus sp. TaxID=2047741 RepID=UPI00397BC103
MSMPSHRDKQRRRLERQFGALERASPDRARPLLRWARHPQAWLVRAPLGVLLVAGGLLAFLPVLGLWMLPVGLLLLAVDMPLLRAPVSAATIRLRRRWQTWRRRRTR